MKKIPLVLLFSFGALFCSAQPDRAVDTLYYGSDHKAPQHRALADYYMIVPATADTCSRKPFRSFYMTGELRTEGGYIRLDSTDALKTVYDGQLREYYRSGRIRQQATWRNGKREGECFIYSENGLIEEHAFYADGKLIGTRTVFEGDGCIRTEYENGALADDCYNYSDARGLWGRYRLADDTPVFESPQPDEICEAYRDGQKWKYYNKDGLIVSMAGNRVRDYGKYYRMKLTVTNASPERVEFDPAKILSSLTDKAQQAYALAVYTSEEYLSKVRRRQSWNSFFYGLTVDLEAVEAEIAARKSGGSASADNASLAAYQARMIAREQSEAFSREIRFERTVREEGYLKRTTLFPGDTAAGYVLIERRKGTTLYVTVDVNGAVFAYAWNIGQEMPWE